MIIKKYSFIILLLLIPLKSILCQDDGLERFQEMKNAFILGLPEKGLEIGVELLSLRKYSSIREEAVFYIADFFLLNALQTENSNDVISYVNKAYTYYIVYQHDFPNSKYSKIVDSRVSILKSMFQDRVLIRDMNDYLQNEYEIVKRKIDFVNTLFKFNRVYPFAFFFKDLENDDPLNILDRYLDDIIINHPDFKIYGYYKKILSRLSMFENINFVSDGLLKFKVSKISADFETYGKDNPKMYKSIIGQSTVNKLLDSLDINYPHHPITLNLHLIFAKIFMIKKENVYNYTTKEHLEFVIQNELDKTSPRYMFAREFLLDHKFAEKK